MHSTLSEINARVLTFGRVTPSLLRYDGRCKIFETADTMKKLKHDKIHRLVKFKYI